MPPKEKPCEKRPLTKADIESIVSDKLDDLHERLKDNINTTKNAIVSSLGRRIEVLENSVFKLETSVDALKEEVRTLKAEKGALQDKAEKAERAITALSDKLNDLEQHSRKSNIRMWGIKDKKDESVDECVNKVVDVLKNKCDMGTITPSDISIAHRLGRFREPTEEQKAPPPRAIIVRFMNRKTKIEAMKKKSNLKNTQYRIREDLTRTNQNLLLAAAEDGRVEYTYSRDGKVYVKLDNKRFPKQIRRLSDLDFLARRSDFNLEDYTSGANESQMEWTVPKNVDDATVKED